MSIPFVRDLGLEEKNQNGCYVSPTVLTNVPESDEVWNDEVFGPGLLGQNYIINI